MFVFITTAVRNFFNAVVGCFTGKKFAEQTTAVKVGVTIATTVVAGLVLAFPMYLLGMTAIIVAMLAEAAGILTAVDITVLCIGGMIVAVGGSQAAMTVTYEIAAAANASDEFVADMRKEALAA